MKPSAHFATRQNAQASDLHNLKKWLKVIGLFFLLLAWGSETFWKNPAEDRLRKIEFSTINGGIVANYSDIQFLKYVLQNRIDPNNLNLSYQALLEDVLSTWSILKHSGANPSAEIFSKANTLREDLMRAYDKKQSLEPRDVGRSIKSEIVELQKKLQNEIVKWLQDSRGRLKTASEIFIFIYFLGSCLLIISEFIDSKSK